jgi:hypothetical protein
MSAFRGKADIIRVSRNGDNKADMNVRSDECRLPPKQIFSGSWACLLCAKKRTSAPLFDYLAGTLQGDSGMARPRSGSLEVDDELKLCRVLAPAGRQAQAPRSINQTQNLGTEVRRRLQDAMGRRPKTRTCRPRTKNGDRAGVA